jgi:hypothetical protein
VARLLVVQCNALADLCCSGTDNRVGSSIVVRVLAEDLNSDGSLLKPISLSGQRLAYHEAQKWRKSTAVAKAQDVESGLSRGPRSGQRVPSGACDRCLDRDHPVCLPARPPRLRVSSGTRSAAGRVARPEHRSSVPSKCPLTRLIEPLTSQRL